MDNAPPAQENNGHQQDGIGGGEAEDWGLHPPRSGVEQGQESRGEVPRPESVFDNTDTRSSKEGAPETAAAVVARRLLTRDRPAWKGVPHVSSSPSLAVGLGDGIDTAAVGAAALSEPTGERAEGGVKGGSPMVAMAGKNGGNDAKKSPPAKAPKSEPKKRRGSAPIVVGAKPGFLAKMMAKVLYPDAKVRDDCVFCG